MPQKEVGHHFLARLGKKRLRPGGITATNWLMAQGQLTSETQILEVACNMGTTSIELATQYYAQITGVDLDPKALANAQQNIERAGVTDYVHLQQANALKLPFADNTFDVVINEAMLTMLNQGAKEKALQEYYRVLKPGGRLLTHDVAFQDPAVTAVLDTLRHTINVNVEPLQVDTWTALFSGIGFKNVTRTTGKMTLMSAKGMLKDEGLFNTIKIISRGLQPANSQMFKQMHYFFTKTGKDLCYIAVCSTK